MPSQKAVKMWSKGIQAVQKQAKARQIANIWGRDNAWRRLKEVGVSGIDAAMDSSSPLMRRILWALVLSVCFALMLLQCCDRVLRFLDEPVNVNVRVTHNASLEFPSVTVCNKHAFNDSKAYRVLLERGLIDAKNSLDSSNIKISQLVGIDGMTSTAVWMEFALTRKSFITECWFGRGVACEDIGKWTMVHTAIGPCYLFEMDNQQINMTGTFNNLYLRFEDASVSRNSNAAPGVRVVLHERHDSPVLLVRTQSIAVDFGWARDVKLELRKFRTLNTGKAPCFDDPLYSEAKCHLQCFQNELKNSLGCKMPYVETTGDEMLNSSIRECASAQEYEEALAAIDRMLEQGGWGTHACNCLLECHETTFLAYPESFAFKPKSIRMRIFYNELVYEQIEEEFAYTMIALLCDIGGTLGLMMGASVLTVCELMEVAWSRLLKVGCKKKLFRNSTAVKVVSIQVLKPPSNDILRKQSKLDLKTLEEEYFGELIFM